MFLYVIQTICYSDSIQLKNPFNKIFLLTGEKFILQVNKKIPHVDRKNESMIKIWILYGFYMDSFYQPISISVIDLNYIMTR